MSDIRIFQQLVKVNASERIGRPSPPTPPVKDELILSPIHHIRSPSGKDCASSVGDCGHSSIEMIGIALGASTEQRRKSLMSKDRNGCKRFKKSLSNPLTGATKLCPSNR